MKHLIQIAYFFPPEGSAGTHRPLRFARHLPHTGWLPTVISAEPYRYERPDPELLQTGAARNRGSACTARDLWHAIQAKREERVQQQISTGSSDGIGTYSREASRAAPYSSKESRPSRRGSVLSTGLREALDQACDQGSICGLHAQTAQRHMGDGWSDVRLVGRAPALRPDRYSLRARSPGSRGVSRFVNRSSSIRTGFSVGSRKRCTVCYGSESVSPAV